MDGEKPKLLCDEAAEKATAECGPKPESPDQQRAWFDRWDRAYMRYWLGVPDKGY